MSRFSDFWRHTAALTVKEVRQIVRDKSAFFHERDFGDKTKSPLSPRVTGSKSSSWPAQEVS